MIRLPKDQLVRYKHQGAGLLVAAYEQQLKTIQSMSDKIHALELENSAAWVRVEQVEKQIKNHNEMKAFLSAMMKHYADIIPENYISQIKRMIEV